MGSMGLLLADWSVELFRARRRKAKMKKTGKKMEEKDAGIDREGGCHDCQEKLVMVGEVDDRVARGEQERGRLEQLVGARPGELVAAVEDLVAKSGELRQEAEQLKAEGKRMAESVGRQLVDRDSAHGERVRALEILMAEKEKQLLQSSNLLRQQLAAGKKERDQLQRQLDEKKGDGFISTSGQWEAECESLKLVLDIRREEADQLKAANNSLRLELERYTGLEVQLQVQRQRAEELGAVVGLKNDQLRQVLDEYDCVQQQLELEVAAHLACQQELERSQWVADNILSTSQSVTKREKSWKNLSNQVESGLILDVVHKGEKGLAYSFNC